LGLVCARFDLRMIDIDARGSRDGLTRAVCRGFSPRGIKPRNPNS
jgi:hypothetical protein